MFKTDSVLLLVDHGYSRHKQSAAADGTYALSIRPDLKSSLTARAVDADKRRLVNAPVSQHDYLLFVIVIKPYKDLLAYHILDDLDRLHLRFLEISSEILDINDAVIVSLQERIDIIRRDRILRGTEKDDSQNDRNDIL